MTLLTRIWVVLLGCVLLYTGTSKALDLESFRRTLHTHEVLPPAVVPAASIGAPAAVWLVGAFAVATALGGRGLWAGCVAVLSLFAAFTVYLGFLYLANGSGADCGCGLPTPTASDGPVVGAVRNGLVVLLPAIWLGTSLLTPARAPAAA